MVRPDAERAAQLFAAQDQGAEAFGDPLDLLVVLGVAVLADLELLFVGEVSRVHPNFFDGLGREHGGVRREMDVGDQGHPHLAAIELGADLSQRFGVAQ